MIELPEGLRPKRIETLGPIRTNLHKARLVQDAEMPRDPRLVDADGADDIVHRMLPTPQHLHDVAARGVGQGLEHVYMHSHAYAYSCMYTLSTRVRELEPARAVRYGSGAGLPSSPDSSLALAPPTRSN